MLVPSAAICECPEPRAKSCTTVASVVVAILPGNAREPFRPPAHHEQKTQDEDHPNTQLALGVSVSSQDLSLGHSSVAAAVRRKPHASDRCVAEPLFRSRPCN